MTLDYPKKTQYVLAYTQVRDKPVLIRKLKPAWQRGMLNLPGGKIEEGETPEVAAARELKEETGLESVGVILRMGALVGDNYEVHVCNTICGGGMEPRQMEDEELVWDYWRNVRDSKFLIPNLRLVIPLCQAVVTGWEIEDNDFQNRNPEVHGVCSDFRVVFP